MFKLGDFPFTWFQVVTVFTNPPFYMFLKIQMAQITEFIKKKNSCTWKECGDKIQLNRVRKLNVIIF
jgi:uncharacterized protein YehS (DUF1456 family)